MLPLLAIGAGLQLGTAAVNAIRSNNFRKRAQRDLDNLIKNPISPYQVSNELRGLYSQAQSEATNPMGYSQAERNAFDQSLARQNNASMYNAQNFAGGNLARTLRGALNAGSINAINQFAANNNAVMRSNRQSALGRLQGATSAIQGINNMNAQANIQAQQALGQSIATQRENIGRAFSAIGGLGGMMAGYGLSGLTGMAGLFNGGMGVYNGNGALPPSKTYAPSWSVEDNSY